MREPRLYSSDGSGPGVPFSQLPARDLRTIAAGLFEACPTPGDPDGDADFARRYAALLLKERGLS